MREKLNILIHGEPKVGKTTFGVKRNPNVLILDTEGSSKLVRGVQRLPITAMGQMDTVLSKIKSGEVKTVIIDTLDELVGHFAVKEVKEMGGQYVYNKLLSQSGYGQLRDRFLTLTRAYRDAGADVLTICHSDVEELPNGGKKMTMRLPSDYAKQVFGQMDIVGFLEVVRDNGKDVHRMNLRKSPFYDAGCRSIYDAVEDKHYDVLPPYIDDPAFIDIIRAYDDFFNGSGKGFVVQCSNCKLKGEAKDAAIRTDNMDLCVECNERYLENKADTKSA